MYIFPSVAVTVTARNLQQHPNNELSSTEPELLEVHWSRAAWGPLNQITRLVNTRASTETVTAFETTKQHLIFSIALCYRMTHNIDDIMVSLNLSNVFWWTIFPINYFSYKYMINYNINYVLQNIIVNFFIMKIILCMLQWCKIREIIYTV